tara:strand:+ start:661 stop:1080 length:420 start_codon:yes stop_codon:yes gene_type:complete
MITEEAKKKINLFLQNFFTTGNVGTGSDSTNPNSNSLDVPILASNSSLTVTNTGDTSTDFKMVVLGSQLSASVVREFGIFGTLPQDDAFDEMYGGTSNPATDGSNYASETTMLSRLSFEGLGPFNNSDEITFTLSVEVE